jgi:hypothetical protein
MNRKFLPLLFLSFTLAFLSCDYKNKPYLKHEIKAEKSGTDCNNLDPNISVEANTIGERYVFQQCLSASYKENYAVERKGDTVNILFGKTPGTEALYTVTVDINTRPEYNFLTINGNTMPVKVSRY